MNTLSNSTLKILFAEAKKAHQRQNFDKARNLYASILQEDFSHVEARGNLATLLRQLSLYEAASTHYELLMSINTAESKNADRLSNYANNLLEANHFERALNIQRRASSLLNDDDPRVCFNLGTALRDNGKLKEAARYFARAKELKYPKGTCDFNEGLAHLALGNYEKGFALFDARFEEHPHYFPLHKKYPIWRGEETSNQTLLLTREQGFGDVIQFLRFLPDIAQKFAKVLFLIKEPLIPLVEHTMQLPKNVVLIAEEKCRKRPEADFYLPILSLAHRQSLGKNDIERDNTGYLHIPHPPDIRIEQSTNLKIGIAWCGSATHKNDRNRSMSIKEFCPLFARPAQDLYSLQYGKQNDAILQHGFEAIVRVPDWKQHNFFELAQVISQLDMVVAVDTAVVHLAGALGKPTVMLANHRPEWRWLYKQKHSPWYKSVQIFHQSQHCSWQEPIGKFLKTLA